MLQNITLIQPKSVIALLIGVIPSILYAEIFQCHENGVTFFQESACNSPKNIKPDLFSNKAVPKHSVKQKIKAAILEIAPLKKQLVEIAQRQQATRDEEVWLSHEYGHTLVDLNSKTIQVLFDAYKLGLPDINGETGSLTLVYQQRKNTAQPSWQCRAYGNSTRFAPTKCQIK